MSDVSEASQDGISDEPQEEPRGGYPPEQGGYPAEPGGYQQRQGGYPDQGYPPPPAHEQRPPAGYGQQPNQARAEPLPRRRGQRRLQHAPWAECLARGHSAARGTAPAGRWRTVGNSLPLHRKSG